MADTSGVNSLLRLLEEAELENRILLVALEKGQRAINRLQVEKE
jgi:hypothetical protein